VTLARQAAARIVAEMPTLPKARFELRTAQEVDRLGLGDGAPAELEWIRVAPRNGPPVVVVAAEDGDGTVSPADVLVRLSAGRPDLQWMTHAGGSVRWTGPPVRACDCTGRLAATATNDVQVVDVGRSAVLKVYRILGSDRGEGTVLAALDGTFTPRPVAKVYYHPPAGGPVTCLALATERIPGRTLDEPLLDSLRHRWRTGRSGLDRRTVLALIRVRSALDGLHAALEQAGSPHVSGDPGRAAFIRREALRAEVCALVRDERGRAVTGAGAYPASKGTAQAVRVGVRAVLAATAAAATRATRLDVAPAHGDLHLAHVLMDGERVRFVDVARPEPYSSRADDGAALRRAVECMVLDVMVHRAAAKCSRPTIEIVDELLTRAFCAASKGLGGQIDVFGPLEAVIPMELTAARAWTAQTCRLLDPGGWDGTPRLPYLSRLIHDLRHHSDRGDDYHAGLAWCHLVQACSGDAARTPRSGLPEEPQ
jgi:hypothetical protein